MTTSKIAVLGATGKVGFSAAATLRAAGVPVRAVVRDAAKATALQALGCEVGTADLLDPIKLRNAIAGTDAVQVLLPPPPQAEDAPTEMHQIAENLAEVIAETQPRRVVAISDYGAHLGEGVGMPSMFHAFEDQLRHLDNVDVVLLRSAEHMEGWAPFIPGAVATGVLPSFHHPVDAKFPTVSAPDVGLIAADILRDESGGIEQVVHVEGPRRYSANDVAESLSHLVGSPVAAQELPRSQWSEVLRLGLSASAAHLVIDVYDAHNKGGLIDVEPGSRAIRYGRTALTDALRPLMTMVEPSSN